MTPTYRPLLLALLALPALGGVAPAAVVVIDATDRGWHNADGVHVASNLNFVAGLPSAFDGEFRNWYVFDLPALAPGETIVSAGLRAFNPDAGGFNGFDSSDPSETYTLFDYGGTITALRKNRGSGGAAGVSIFADLGTGTTFGGRDFSNADNGTFSTVALNADGLAAVTASAGGLFAFGGRVTTLAGAGRQVVFASTFPPEVPLEFTQLVLDIQPAAVPAPPAVVLAALGGVLVTVRRRLTRG